MIKPAHADALTSDSDPEWAHLSNNAKGTPTERERIEQRQRTRARAKASERFVRLGNDLTSSPAWRALGPYARDALVWLTRRYRGTNNGRIPMSVRELAKDMGVASNTAHKALVRLEVFGFIATATKGRMGAAYAQGAATRWRLTDYSLGAVRATRDYLDIDIQAAERSYNIYFERRTRKHAASHDVTQERTTCRDAPDYGKSNSEEKRGGASHDVRRTRPGASHVVRQSVAVTRGGAENAVVADPVVASVDASPVETVRSFRAGRLAFETAPGCDIPPGVTGDQLDQFRFLSDTFGRRSGTAVVVPTARAESDPQLADLVRTELGGYPEAIVFRAVSGALREAAATMQRDRQEGTAGKGRGGMVSLLRYLQKRIRPLADDMIRQGDVAEAQDRTEAVVQQEVLQRRVGAVRGGGRSRRVSWDEIGAEVFGAASVEEKAS